MQRRLFNLALCLVIGAFAAGYNLVWLFFPKAIAALNLPTFVVALSLPVISVIALIAGVVATRLRNAHCALAAIAICMNFAAAAHGLYHVLVIAWGFSRAWNGTGKGP